LEDESLHQWEDQSGDHIWEDQSGHQWEDQSGHQWEDQSGDHIWEDQSGNECHCFSNEGDTEGYCEGGTNSAGGPGLPMGICMQDPLCHWGPEEDPMCWEMSHQWEDQNGDHIWEDQSGHQWEDQSGDHIWEDQSGCPKDAPFSSISGTCLINCFDNNMTNIKGTMKCVCQDN